MIVFWTLTTPPYGIIQFFLQCVRASVHLVVENDNGVALICIFPITSGTEHLFKMFSGQFFELMILSSAGIKLYLPMEVVLFLDLQFCIPAILYFS